MSQDFYTFGRLQNDIAVCNFESVVEKDIRRIIKNWSLRKFTKFYYFQNIFLMQNIFSLVKLFEHFNYLNKLFKLFDHFEYTYTMKKVQFYSSPIQVSSYLM